MSLDAGLMPLALAALLLLSIFAVPLAAAVFFSGVLLLSLNAAPLPPDFLLVHSLAMRLDSPALVSIPLFAMAGELATEGGITGKLLDVAEILGKSGWTRAGRRGVVGCALFSTVSGVGPAAVMASGERLFPAMIRAGHSRESAAGLVAAAASLAIIIPASVPQTVYAATVVMPTNIVFAASFVPGVLTAAVLALVAPLGIRRRGGASIAAGALSRSAVLWRAKWSLLMPAIVLTTLFTGFFSAPEAAAFSCAYAMAVGRYAHGLLGWSDIRRCAGRAIVAASAILLLVGMGGLYVALLETAGAASSVCGKLYELAGGAAGSIAVMNAILLAAGCFLEPPAVIALIAPALLPLVELSGMSLAQYGVMVTVNIAIGLITPPQAPNLAAAAKLTGVGVWASARASWLFLAAMLACLALVSYVPEVSLWLPRWLGWKELGM